MATRKELNDFYKKIYNKDFPSSTLSKWKKEGKIRVVELSKELKKGASQYDYNLEDFKKIVCSEDYQKRIKATKENPKNYIGKQCGYLLIKDIVPKEEKKDKKYIGTVMYCQCLRCNRPDLVQVRFSYLTPNGNYKSVLIASKNIKTGEKYSISIGNETYETEITEQSTVIGTQSSDGMGFGRRQMRVYGASC